MRLQHLEYLIGLIAIPALVFLFWWILQWKKKTAKKMGDEKLIQQLVGSYSPKNFLIKFILAVTAITGIILGASNLQKKGEPENVTLAGVDVMLVLDVSKSMLANDIQPSRLEKAKQLLMRLLDKLENDRVGLILFAGHSYMQMPLTTDENASRMYIQNASPDAVPTQGTVIAEALRMADNAFNSKEHKYKAVVLISDGEDHDPEALNVAKQLAEDGVMINTIGIGSPDGAPIIDPVTRESKKDENGQVVISKLNEAELSQLADATNGIYMRLDNMDAAVIALSQRLNGIEKKALTDTDFINYKNYFQWFLAVALLLLVIEFFLPERKTKLA
ncbi:MAG: VWA domain-containing protein [Bacteroidetes bacterium]|nr:VWA domain-containing protein [Bacteroidota bacterium]